MENHTQLPYLTQNLQDQDLGFLQIVAELWGVELNAPDARQGRAALTTALSDPLLVEEIVDSLPAEAIKALSDLCTHDGRLPWALFIRRYGEVRRFGPARRDREKPYREPSSVAEMLWYRAFVGRTFFDTPTGPQEFAYIPLDLYEQLPLLTLPEEVSLGRPASPGEQVAIWRAQDRILDHACTLLAAIRTGLPAEEISALSTGWNLPGAGYPLKEQALRQLLVAAQLLDEMGRPEPEKTRLFLETSRPEALTWLVRNWLPSVKFNELHLIPGLVCEGDWQNDPRLARQSILAFTSDLPQATWWHLPSFITGVHSIHPDYQRPGGDYDSWFIRDEASGEFLRGFADWDRVDGELIRFLITGPFFWLGLTELAASGEDQQPVAFRLSVWSQNLLQGRPPSGLPAEDETIVVRSDGRMLIKRLAPRAVRYQAARFCEWEGEKDGTYHFRLTPASLERARQNGLRLEHLYLLLQKHSGGIPAGIKAALKRWETYGTELRLEQLTVLRTSSPEVMQTIRNSRAARFLGDPLGPTAVAVNPGAVEKVLAIVNELGFLGHVQTGG